MGGLLPGILSPNPAPNPQAPPLAPTLDTQAVKDNAQNELKKRAAAQGRASTILTDPSTQREPDLNQQRMALG
jgi:hypothetical protein